MNIIESFFKLNNIRMLNRHQELDLVSEHLLHTWFHCPPVDLFTNEHLNSGRISSIDGD